MGERIAVLGGGPMGLAVAYQLARDGHQPVLFEADDRLGGMTASFDFAGLNIERYYHFHCTSDRDFMQLLDELQMADRLHWVETKMGFWFRGKLQPWGDPVALLKFQGLGLVAKLRYGMHAFLATRRNRWHRLDRLVATAWIRRWVGDEAYEVLWRRLFEYKFYHLSDTISAAWIWSRVRRVGRSRYNLFREKLGYLEGGSQTLIDALRREILERGGEIRLGTPVERVVIEDGRVAAIATAGRNEPFTKVVSTVPIRYLPTLIPDLPVELVNRYRSLKNIAVVCVIVKLRRQLSRNFWVNTNDPAMDIPGLVEYSNLRPLDEHVVYVPFYMPGEHPHFADPDRVFEEKVRRYLAMIEPALGDQGIQAVHVSRYRYAQPICEPGHLERLPPVALPMQGLWAADTSYYYPEDRGISESIGFGRELARQVTT